MLSTSPTSPSSLTLFHTQLFNLSLSLKPPLLFLQPPLSLQSSTCCSSSWFISEVSGSLQINKSQDFRHSTSSLTAIFWIQKIPASYEAHASPTPHRLSASEPPLKHQGVRITSRQRGDASCAFSHRLASRRASRRTPRPILKTMVVARYSTGTWIIIQFSFYWFFFSLGGTGKVQILTIQFWWRRTYHKFYLVEVIWSLGRATNKK